MSLEPEHMGLAQIAAKPIRQLGDSRGVRQAAVVDLAEWCAGRKDENLGPVSGGAAADANYLAGIPNSQEGEGAWGKMDMFIVTPVSSTASSTEASHNHWGGAELSGVYARIWPCGD